MYPCDSTREVIDSAGADRVDSGSAASSRLPSVSILLPVRNEEGYIEACLNSLLSQDYPALLEILVFDGKSTDRTRTIVEALRQKSGVICLLENERIGQAAALNLGVRLAKGEIIVRADGHALYEPDYISQCVSHLMRTGAANVGGAMRPVIEGGAVARAIGFCHISKFGIGVARFHSGDFEGVVDTVWLGAFWKRVFAEVGLFDETLPRAEDNEFNARLRAAGHTIYLTPKIKSHYQPRKDLPSFLKQAYENGKGVGRAAVAAPRSISLRHIVPGGFVICVGGLGVLSLGATWPRIALAAGIAAHFGAGTLFSLSPALKDGLSQLLILPWLYFLLHVSYGLGTVSGLVVTLWRGLQASLSRSIAH